MNAKLSSEQKAALEKQHKTERDRRIADRIKAVLLSVEGMNESVRNNRFFESADDFRNTIMNFFHEKWPKISSSMTSVINDNFQILKQASST